MLRAICLAAVIAISLMVLPVSRVSAEDTTPPIINSVTVTPSLVAAADAVHIKVDVSDDTAVAEVAANSVNLTAMGGGIWEGDITAESAEGYHSVTVVASDAAGNSSADTSGQYRTAHVYGINTNAALSTVANLASTHALFQVLRVGDIYRRQYFQSG